MSRKSTRAQRVALATTEVSTVSTDTQDVSLTPVAETMDEMPPMDSLRDADDTQDVSAPAADELHIVDPSHVETFEDAGFQGDAQEASAPAADMPNVPEVVVEHALVACSIVFSASSVVAYDIAQSIARKYKCSVSLARGDADVLVIEAPADKPKRVIAPMDTSELPVYLQSVGSLSKTACSPVKVLTQPTAQQKAVIRLCTRPQGASTADLYTTTTSTTGVPWRDVVANCAKRFNYVMSTTSDDKRRVSYHLHSLDD